MTAAGHGVYDDGQPDRAYTEPRCPRCTSWTLTGVGDQRWWCLDCDLVVTCTRAEWDALAEERALWAKGEHPVQQPPQPPPAPVHVPHEHYACQVCGQAHATRPDRRVSKPRTSVPAAPARADYRRRWTAGSSTGQDPDGRAIAWPHGTPDELHEEPATGALDPAVAEAALLADMNDHDERRSA